MKLQIRSAVGMVLLSLSTGALAADGPLQIAKQGSLEVGGEFLDCATNDGGDPNSRRWPAGRGAINHLYATYQYPYYQPYEYPIINNPAGGPTALVYDPTPAGSAGWLTLFLREGLPVICAG